MAVSIIRARVHEVDYPGLNRGNFGNETRYHGTRDAFEHSGLMPSGTPFPGEVPGKRGSRWRDSDGRRFVLSKGGRMPATFFLSVYLTDEEYKDKRHRLNVQNELDKLNEEIASLDSSMESFRDLAWSVAALHLSGSSAPLAGQHVWRYSPAVLTALNRHSQEIFTLLKNGEILRQSENSAKLETMKKSRAALTNTKLRKTVLTLVK